MKRSKTRAVEIRAEPVSRSAIPIAEYERIMALARRQRAEEMARLTRLAATKIAGGIEGIFQRIFKHREACRTTG